MAIELTFVRDLATKFEQEISIDIEDLHAMIARVSRYNCFSELVWKKLVFDDVVFMWDKICMRILQVT